MKASVHLLTGSNLGNRSENLRKANDEIAINIGEIKRISAVYKTDAWGKQDQPAFLNQALKVITTLSPEDVLRKITDIEGKIGRQKREKWGSREIDIDILFFGDDVIDVDGLKIPHPYLQDRKFALAPLAEIAPDLVHPVLKTTVSELLLQCKDPLSIEIFNEIL